MKKTIYVATALLFFAGSAAFAQTGNVGIGTATPASKLTVNGNTSIGTGYSGTAAPANGAIIQGNVGIGTSAPTAKLHVAGNVAIVDGTEGAGKLLVSDANGLASWQSPAQTKEVMALAPTAIQTVLDGVAPGSGTALTNFSQAVNTISGASFAGGAVNLPVGTYEITTSLEMGSPTGTCPAAGFLINSYFIDFPVTGRIHANSPSVCGINGVHAAQWTTTVIAPAGGTAWGLTLGRGIGGNYSGTVNVNSSSRIIIKKIL